MGWRLIWRERGRSMMPSEFNGIDRQTSRRHRVVSPCFWDVGLPHCRRASRVFLRQQRLFLSSSIKVLLLTDGDSWPGPSVCRDEWPITDMAGVFDYLLSELVLSFTQSLMFPLQTIVRRSPSQCCQCDNNSRWVCRRTPVSMITTCHASVPSLVDIS